MGEGERANTSAGSRANISINTVRVYRGVAFRRRLLRVLSQDLQGYTALIRAAAGGSSAVVPRRDAMTRDHMRD